MFGKKFTLPRWKVAIATVAIGAVLVIPAAAQDTVTQTVNSGTRTASIADQTLTAVGYSHSNQTNTGALTLTADDSTGTDAGWNVTVLASDFTSLGTDSIAASNFSITTANEPTVNEGQAIDTADTPPGGPKAGVGGTLDTARMVLEAEVGYGKGNYSQVLDVELTIPGQTLADTYTSDLTVTIASGPGA